MVAPVPSVSSLVATPSNTLSVSADASITVTTASSIAITTSAPVTTSTPLVSDSPVTVTTTVITTVIGGHKTTYTTTSTCTDENNHKPTDPVVYGGKASGPKGYNGEPQHYKGYGPGHHRSNRKNGYNKNGGYKTKDNNGFNHYKNNGHDDNNNEHKPFWNIGRPAAHGDDDGEKPTWNFGWGRPSEHQGGAVAHNDGHAEATASNWSYWFGNVGKEIAEWIADHKKGGEDSRRKDDGKATAHAWGRGGW